MRFLADESCDFTVVRALRSVGHDVLAAAEVHRQADDDEVASLAASEDRILLTEDKDFGRLVYAASRPSGGVVLIRFPAGQRGSLAPAVVRLVQDHGDRLPGLFVVVTPGRVRIRRIR